MSRLRVPVLANPNIVVRLTNDPTEIDAANRLVFGNYVAAGFWENDEGRLRANKFLHTPARHVFVVLENERLVGTMSIIIDSATGLPSDAAQPAALQKLRAKGGALAEVSAFAMDRSNVLHRKLVFFLISYMFQYSFYYAGVHTLVASCVSAHADFYESTLCFSKISDPTYYAYTHVVGHFLSLDLVEAHSLFARKYPSDPATGESYYRFMLCDPQPCQHFPLVLSTSRSRQFDWSAGNFAKAA
jgi:hypothetical protein